MPILSKFVKRRDAGPRLQLRDVQTGDSVSLVLRVIEMKTFEFGTSSKVGLSVLFEDSNLDRIRGVAFEGNAKRYSSQLSTHEV